MFDRMPLDRVAPRCWGVAGVLIVGVTCAGSAPAASAQVVDRPVQVIVNSSTQRANDAFRSDVILNFMVESEGTDFAEDEEAPFFSDTATFTRARARVTRQVDPLNLVKPLQLDLQLGVTNTGGNNASGNPLNFEGDVQVLIGERFTGLDPNVLWRLRYDAPPGNTIANPLNENTSWAGIFLADGSEVVPRLTSPINAGEQVSEPFSIPAGETYFLTYFLDANSQVSVPRGNFNNEIFGINSVDDIGTLATLTIERAGVRSIVPSPSALALGLGLMGLCLRRRAGRMGLGA